MALTLSERYQGLVEPGFLLFIAMKYFFLTVFEIIWVQRAPLKLFPISELRAKAFSRFWLAVSSPLDSPAQLEETPESPFASLPRHLAAASGTVLDIGPGSGTFTMCFNPAAIKAIYGAEPALDLHSTLKKRAEDAGLGAKYHVLPCGGERDSLLPALAKAGLLEEVGGQVKEEGVFDTIICIRVLCSVPDIESSMVALYALLRPGGKFIICEHVVNPWRTSKGSILGRGFQLLFTLLGWPFFVGDCRMDRDTATLLKTIGDAQGGWESVELDKKMEWSVLPWTSGVYVKRSAGKM